MAVRRARIKPVISLPPRRKNNDAGNNTKTKSLEIKSPQTPLDTIGTQDNLDRRSQRPGPLLKSPLPVTNMFKYQGEKVPSPVVQTEVSKEVSVTPKTSENVWVDSDNNVFVSPRNVGSPEKRPAEADIIDGKSKKAKKDVTCTIVSSDVPDYDSVPNVTESSTEDIVMDGIVPLQAVSSAPKPLEYLKNSIISENAEVLFDPILPLPSPSKVRPKLRPVPRLSSIRKKSVQVTPLESEDESRRALHSGCGPSTSAPRQRHDSQTSLSAMQALPSREVSRVRTDSMSSSVSEAPTQTVVALSPVKDMHVLKPQRVYSARRAAAMHRRTENVNKDTLTMYDLIFYNPSTNPIVPDEDERNAKESNEEEAHKAVKESEGKVQDTSKANGDPAPVPQIKLDPNGEIVLDENSLVINQTQKRTLSSSVVREGSWSSSGTVGSYRRTPRTKDWSDPETVRFYRALASLGTDFMALEHLFPGRTRREIKFKFKREERVNMAQIEKALRGSFKWDMTLLMNEFATEREAEEQAKLEQRARERQQEKNKKRRPRLSRGSKALGLSVQPSKESNFTANSIIEMHLESLANKKNAPAQPRKRGRPKAKPAPPSATITQDTQDAPHTLPTGDVATTHNGRSSKALGSSVLPSIDSNLMTELHQETKASKKNAPAQPRKRGRPKAKPAPPSATITQDTQDAPHTLPTGDVATTHNIESPKPQDNMPDEIPNIPVRPPNIVDGSLVLVRVNAPNSNSLKMLKSYQASPGDKLTPIVVPPAFLDKIVSLITNTEIKWRPHQTSCGNEASQGAQST